MQDASYFLLYILAIAPFMTLLSVGSAVILRSHATWLQATWTAQWPRWTVVVVTLLAMDLCNWLAHWGDHRIGALWRVHALHHSQEELSVLTSFRAHPLMHTTGFVLATVPVLLLTGAHPLAPVLITVYVCLGTLPHTNVRWSYGPLGRVLVSPAYHRQHHAIDGRQEANLGVVLTVWDVLAGRARFPVRGAAPCATGLAGRPVLVEQAGGERGALPRCACWRASWRSRLGLREARGRLAVQAARRQAPAGGHEGQRLRRPRHQGAGARRPVQVVRPQLHVAEVDPEQVRSRPSAATSPSTERMHASGTRRGSGTASSMSSAWMTQWVSAPSLAATRRLPPVQHRRTEVGQEGGRRAARRRVRRPRRTGG